MTESITKIAGLMKTARLRTSTPNWELCYHLQSVENDQSCPCGFRGLIWSGGRYAVCEMGSSDTPGEEALDPERLPRSQEIACAQYITFAANNTDRLCDAVIAQDAQIKELTTALKWYAQGAAVTGYDDGKLARETLAKYESEGGE